MTDNKKPEIATFGAGCFWRVEETFRHLAGVKSTVVGFMGGNVPNPSYEKVCDGDTGHAEVVRIEYDPDGISYEELLKIFWGIHDPTTLNRQGPDVGGHQYRSAIFCHSPEQEGIAKNSKTALEKSGKYNNPIVTEIAPAGPFYPAEEYHQQYLEKRGFKQCHV